MTTESTDDKLSFPHQRCVLPDDEEDEPDSGQYRSCSLITMETYNIPHDH